MYSKAAQICCAAVQAQRSESFLPLARSVESTAASVPPSAQSMTMCKVSRLTQLKA